MPRLGNRVPKYRRHRQSGQAIVTINGRDYLLGRHGTKASEIEYDRLITEWLSSGRSSTFGVPEHVVTITEPRSIWQASIRPAPPRPGKMRKRLHRWNVVEGWCV